MKKTLKILSIICLLLVTTFAITGCNFGNNDDDDDNSSPPSNDDGLTIELQDCQLKSNFHLFYTDYYIEFYLEVKNRFEEVNYLYSNKIKVILVGKNSWLNVNYVFENNENVKALQPLQKTVVKITSDTLSEATKNQIVNIKLNVIYDNSHPLKIITFYQ